MIMVTQQERLNMLEIAFGFYGLKEWTGAGQSNPEVEAFFKELGYDYSDDTAWCSAFVNFIAKKAGVEYSGKLDARSWMKVGTPVSDPKVGDVVVFWRESKNSWKGHVALFINKEGNNIYALGGNQSNMVNIRAYPDYRVLGYRRLS
jgi:uncharacterized protein (TIGR02594 family)